MVQIEHRPGVYTITLFVKIIATGVDYAGIIGGTANGQHLTVLRDFNPQCGINAPGQLTGQGYDQLPVFCEAHIYRAQEMHLA